MSASPNPPRYKLRPLRGNTATVFQVDWLKEQKNLLDNLVKIILEESVDDFTGISAHVCYCLSIFSSPITLVEILGVVVVSKCTTRKAIS